MLTRPIYLFVVIVLGAACPCEVQSRVSMLTAWQCILPKPQAPAAFYKENINVPSATLDPGL